MAALGSLQQMGALSCVPLMHRCSASRSIRPSVMQIQAAQALQGTVVSAKNPKTVIMNYDSFSEHPLYRKRVKKTSRITVHDEEGIAGLGDYIRVVPCRPISKSKRFRVEKVVKAFDFKVDEETGEVASIGNFVSDSEGETSAEEELGIPAEQLA